MTGHRAKVIRAPETATPLFDSDHLLSRRGDLPQRLLRRHTGMLPAVPKVALVSPRALHETALVKSIAKVATYFSLLL
jgi:hypothetical protein